MMISTTMGYCVFAVRFRYGCTPYTQRMLRESSNHVVLNWKWLKSAMFLQYNDELDVIVNGLGMYCPNLREIRVHHRPLQVQANIIKSFDTRLRRGSEDIFSY